MNLVLERVLRFVTVAEQLSFTKAAALLGIDQPWLSRQVMQLEEQLGFMLFDRSGPQIALTPEGREFFESAQQLAQVSQLVRQRAEEMSRRTQSVLRIGTSYATYPIESRERLFKAYTAVRPNVTLELSAFEWSDDVLQKLHAGEVDFAVVIGPLVDPDVEICMLDRIEGALAIPEEDPLAAQPSVALSELRGRRIAVGMKDKTSHRYQNAYSWVREVGGIEVLVPEGRRFIYEAAEKERLVVLSYAPGERIPTTFVRRKIIGPHPIFHLTLARSRRTMSPAGERLWRLGTEMATELHESK